MPNLQGLTEIPLGEVPKGELIPTSNMEGLTEIPRGEVIPSSGAMFKQGVGQGLTQRLQGLEQTADQLNLLLSPMEQRPPMREELSQQTREALRQRAEFEATPAGGSLSGTLGVVAGEAIPDLLTIPVAGGGMRSAAARMGAATTTGGLLGSTYFAETPDEKARNAIYAAAFGGATSALFDTFRINANILNRTMRNATKVPDIARYFEKSNTLSQMTGIDYTLGQATGSRSLQSFENAAINASGSADLVLDYRNKQLAQGLSFLNKTLGKLGDPSVDQAIVGAQLQEGLDSTIDRVVKVRSHLWDRYMDRAATAVGDTPLGVPSATRQALNEIIADVKDPIAPYARSVVKDFEGVLKEAEGKWTLAQYQKALKKYGELSAGTGKPFKDLDVADQKRFFKKVLSAINQDLDVIESGGGVSAEGVKNLRMARQAWKINSEKLDSIENTVLGSALNKGGRSLSPEEFYRKIPNIPASELRTLIPMMDKQDKSIMNNVRARVFKDILENATKETASGSPLIDFNAAEFVKNLSSYPNADLLFAKGGAKEYLTAIQGIKRIANFGNVSGVGQSPLGAATESVGLAGGAVESGGLPNMVFVGRFLAKNLTPERYAKLLMTPEGRKAIEVVSKYNKYPRNTLVSATGVLMDTLTRGNSINYEEEGVQGTVALEPDVLSTEERVR